MLGIAGVAAPWLVMGQVDGTVQRSGLLAAACMTVVLLSGTIALIRRIVVLADELRRADQARDILEQVVDAFPHGVSIKDAGLRYLWANRVHAERTGHDFATLRGMRLDECGVEPQLASTAMEHDRRVLIAGRVEGPVEQRLPLPDGTVAYSYVTKIPVVLDGDVTHVVTVGADVTELHRARQEAEEARRLLEAIMDAAPVTIQVMDADLTILWANRAYREHIKRDIGMDDPIGRRLTAAGANQALVDATIEANREVLRTGRQLAQIEQHYPATATTPECHFLVTKAAIRNGAGKPIQVLTIGTDITARRRAEEALRELNLELERRVEDRAAELAKANDLLGKVVFGAPIPIVTYGRDGRITGWNPAAEHVTGFSAAEVLGRLPPTQDDAGRAQFADMAKRIARGESYTGIEARRARKDGTAIELLISGAPLTNPDGTIMGAIGIWLDVTEHRAVERQLRQAQKMEAVGQLTGGIAHDFNNLLSVVIGNLELAAESHDSADVKSLAANALEAALKSAELTRRLLAFSRQKMQAASRAQPAGVIVGMRDMLARSLGPRIAIELDSGADPWSVMIDVPQLESCIVNLGVNARDAMPDGGRVTISTRNVTFNADDPARPSGLSPGDFVQIAVTDTGTGMPPDILARAFEPFFTTKDVGKGTGLGLSMVYAFASQSRGMAWLRSEAGHGTTVTLLLPRAPEEVADDSAGPGTRRRPPTGGERILVVEDDDRLGATVTRQLLQLGYRPRRVANAAAAMAALSGPEPFDLLFTDIMMPGRMDGRDLAEAATLLRPGLPCLLTTGHEHNKAPTAATSHLPVLTKPYRRDDLARAIRETLEANAG